MVIDDVGAAVVKHHALMQTRATEWGWFEAAYSSEFWTNNPYGNRGGPDDLAGSMWSPEDSDPVKVATNMIWPFVAAQVGNLYLRAPRTRVEHPSVVVGPGRPSKKFAEAPRHIEGVCDDWINSVQLQQAATYAYQLALVHGAAAFKLGYRDGEESPIQRVTLTTIPRWECVWDEEAHPHQELFRGHIRWEVLERAQAIIGDPLEGAQPVNLGNALEELTGHRPEFRRQPTGRYVRILEWYDLETEKQQFYLVHGHGGSVDLQAVGKELDNPCVTVWGQQRTPIEPVILANKLNRPLCGIPAVRRIYQQNAEDNLITTGVANGMRRDMERMRAYQKDRLGDAFFTALKEGGDSRWVPVDGSLEGLWKEIESTPFASSLPMYKEWIDDARQKAQAMSDLMTGRQGKYLTAKEAELLADAGESTTTELGSRMVLALSSVLELFLTTLRDEMDGPIEVYRGGETFRLEPEMLDVPWKIRVVDAASTPVRDSQRKADLLQVMTPYLSLVAAAAPPAVDPETGQPIPSAEVRAASIAMLDALVMAFQLPESLKWSAVQLAAKSLPVHEKPPAPKEAPVPEEEARALMAKVASQIGGA